MPPTLIDSYSLSPVIGIGTYTPNENLTVVGNISASGNVYGTVASFQSVSSGNVYSTVASFQSVSSVNLRATGIIQADQITDSRGGTLVKKKSFTIIGDGTNHQFTLNHNFNTHEVLVQVYEYNTKEIVMCYTKNLNLNNTLIDVGTTLNADVSGYLVVMFC